nr:hypothetical protein [Tanacetum cinerariifolium]
MILETSKAGFVLKFDMHIYVSTLTSKELKEAIDTYGIPTDLNPRLPDPDLTMDKLSANDIGIYVEQLEQDEMRIPFSTFLLVVIKHFRVHISQLVPIGVNKVTMFELRCRSLRISYTVSLFCVFYKLCKQGHWFSFENKSGKCTKKCFREITPSIKGWTKKFFLIDQRAIPDAMAQRDRDTDVSDDFTISYNDTYADMMAKKICKNHHKGDPLLEDQRPLNRTTDPCARQLNAEKPGQNIVEAREKKEKQKSLPLNETVQEGASIGHENSQPDHENPFDVFSPNSFHSASGHHFDDDASIGCFVPNWRFQNNLCICSYYTLRELLSNLATSAENAHSGCSGRLREVTKERDEWSSTADKQVDKIKKLESDLGPKSLRLQEAGERIRHLKKEKKVLIAHLAKLDMALHNVVNELIPKMARRCWGGSNRRGLGVAESHTLPFEELMKITPDVPSAPAKTVAENVESSDPSVPTSSAQTHHIDQFNNHA